MMFPEINDGGASADMLDDFFDLQAVADFCYGTADDVNQLDSEINYSPLEKPIDISMPSSPSADLNEEEMEELFGGVEPESAFELALPQDSTEAHDVIPSSATETEDNVLSKESEIAFKIALPQVHAPVEADSTASNPHQGDKAAAVDKPQKKCFRLRLPQVTAAPCTEKTSESAPQGDVNTEASSSHDTPSTAFEQPAGEKNTEGSSLPSSVSDPAISSAPSVPSLPPASVSQAQAAAGPSSAGLAQMPQFPNVPGYSMMVPGQFPIMGMGPGQHPNFMGMPYSAPFANSFGVGQFNLNPGVNGGTYANFQTAMPYSNHGMAAAMEPSQSLHSAQNSQSSINTALSLDVSTKATQPTEAPSTKVSNAKIAKASKASKAKAQKAQAQKPRKVQALSQQQLTSKKPAPVKNLPAMAQQATGMSSTGLTGWNSQLPPPNPPSQPLGPDQIMSITGFNPMHMPAGVEFVSKFPEVPGCAVRHTAVANLTTQEHELVLHTAARNIFLAGVETGVQRAIQQMINDIDANGNTLGLAPADLPPKGPTRTKMLDLLEKKMKKSAKKWAALTQQEADHVIRPVQAL